MPSVNEDLIRRVFDEMTRHKPALKKYLIPDDDDEEEVDIRLITDQLIKNFPWPIGIELRRLLSGAMRNLDRGRLDQLFKTIERTMQFISFVMIIELYEEIREERLEVKDTFSREFDKRIRVLSMGNFTWFIRSIGTLFSKENVDFYMPETQEICTKKFFDSLDFWVPERNEIGHYQVNLDDAEIEKRCVTYEEKLTDILVSISFLVKYKLVTIREIKVSKRRYRKPEFQHQIDILNSADSDFRSNLGIYREYSDSNAVLLMKSIKEPGDFLNLSPFIIDTRPEVIDSKDKFDLKKDIFLYSKYDGKKLFYSGTQITEKCDLSSISNYPDLLREFEEILDVMRPQPTSTQA